MAQVYLDPVADGVATAWSGAGYLNVAKGATVDDSTFNSSGVAVTTRESYRLANVSSAVIPDGSTIQSVAVFVRAQRGGTQNADYSIQIGTPPGPTWQTSGTLVATSAWVESSFTWAIDPRTSSAWTLATLRSWSTTHDFGVINGQTRDVRVSRMRVLVTYEPPASPTGMAVVSSQGSATVGLSTSRTLTGLGLSSALGTSAGRIGDSVNLTGASVVGAQGAVSITGPVPLVSYYAGSWPEPLTSTYESLDPYYLTPIGTTELAATGVDATVNVSGLSSSVALGAAGTLLPGGLRTVTPIGQAIAVRAGHFQSRAAVGSVLARTRAKWPEGAARWRQRTRTTTVTPAYSDSRRNRTVTLTGAALGSAQGTVSTILPGRVSPSVQIVGRRVRDAWRERARLSSRLTFVTRQTSKDRDARPVGQTVALGQGIVTVTVPRPPFVGQTVVGVSSRTRTLWRTRGRPKSRLTTVSSNNAMVRVVRLTGMNLASAQGTVTSTGSMVRIVNVTGAALLATQGTVSLIRSKSFTVAGLPLTSAFSSVAVRRMSVVGGQLTLGLGTVSIANNDRTVTLEGRALALLQGQVARGLRFEGNTVVTFAPRTRTLTSVSLDANAYVSFTHQVLRNGTLTVGADATLVVAPTQRFVGAASMAGGATLAVDLSAIPPSVATMYQQFDADQQLGFKF